jgi:hypothetical protein
LTGGAVVNVIFLCAISGVSSASALSAGDDSAPEVSENRSASNGLRGVVNEGFRNGAAVWAVVLEKKEEFLVEVFSGLAGVLKPSAKYQSVAIPEAGRWCNIRLNPDL